MIGVAAALVLLACTSNAPTPSASGNSPAPMGFIRDCGSAVFGEPNMKNAIRIGPLALAGAHSARKLPLRAFQQHRGRYGAIKVVAVITGDQDVTVTVPSSQRRILTLLYDPNAQANKYGFLFSAGDPRVTFEACSDVDMNYNGGFIAKQPICAKLQVQTATSSDTATLALGRGSCP